MTDRFADDDTALIPRAERPEPLVTGLAALMAAALTVGLHLGTRAGTVVFALVVLGVQLLLIAAWWGSTRLPGAVGVGVVAAGSALLADGLLVFGPDATAAPLAGVVAASFGATIVAQLLRGEGRRQVTEVFGATMTVVVGVVALATTISLHRQIDGPPLLAACVAAGGAGLVVARVLDLLVPAPAINLHVPRGVVGVLAGSLVGAAVAATSVALSAPLSVPLAALVGWGVALAAVLADVGVGFAAAGRALVEPPRKPSPWRPVLGPVLGMAVAVPAGYVFSLVLFA